VRTWAALVASLGLLLAGCGTAADVNTPSATSSPAAVAGTPASEASPGAGVTLSYDGNAQVELQEGDGPRVMIDVYDPEALTAAPTAADALLTTHTHDDHYVAAFVDDFPGEQLFVRAGRLHTAGAGIRGIAAAHSQGDQLRPKGGSDYLFVVDMGGLRIVHFGDIGQTTLTKRQLQALGEVDVAITQLENSFSQMDMTNKKGFKLMEQVKPRLIVPTHTSAAAVQHAATLWPVVFTVEPSVTISPIDLPGTTTLLLMGRDVAYYADLAGADAVDW
jgi:L-ascorbate metabolism protein UlaG (beta-lactamase superfamily)